MIKTDKTITRLINFDNMRYANELAFTHDKLIASSRVLDSKSIKLN